MSKVEKTWIQGCFASSLEEVAIKNKIINGQTSLEILTQVS